MADRKVETEADFGSDASAEARRWCAEIEVAEADDVSSYLKRCDRIRHRYNYERMRHEGSGDDTMRQYAMLWSNVETLKPAVYSRVPQPVVATRHKDRRPVARMAAEVLQRCLSYALDSYDFDQRMMDARFDYLLYGRSVLWVRYEPVLDGASVRAERVLCDFVSLEDFLTNKARTWAEVRWGARRVYMSRSELIARFGSDVGARVPLDHEVKRTGGEKSGPHEDLYRKATVYEIWDKGSRQVVWVHRGFREAVLDRRPDPLRLRDFFPFPRPAFGTLTTGSLLPVPDFVFYQDQAEEIDTLTQRIAVLSDALRMVGVYAADEKANLTRMLEPGRNNEMIPVDAWAKWGDKGGIRGLIEWMPIEQVSATITACVALRRQLIEDVYQITGLSDILRGASDPRETATAQSLKGQWGSLRVRDRQAEIQRLARDVVRLKAEVMAEMFGRETLAAMSGVELPTREEQQMAVMQMQLMRAQEGSAEPPAGLLETARAEVTWDDVTDLLRDDLMRRFMIDIETDSTIQADEQAEKEMRIEFVTAVSTFLQQAGPVVQAAPEMSEMMGEMLLFGVRSFRAGRQMEDVIERGMAALSRRAGQAGEAAEAPPDPMVAVKQQEAQMRSIVAEQKAQMDAMRLELEGAKVEIARFRAETERAVAQADLGIRIGDQDLKAEALRRDPSPQSIQ